MLSKKLIQIGYGYAGKQKEMFFSNTLSLKLFLIFAFFSNIIYVMYCAHWLSVWVKIIDINGNYGTESSSSFLLICVWPKVFLTQRTTIVNNRFRRSHSVECRQRISNANFCIVFQCNCASVLLSFRDMTTRRTDRRQTDVAIIARFAMADQQTIRLLPCALGESNRNPLKWTCWNRLD